MSDSKKDSKAKNVEQSIEESSKTCFVIMPISDVDKYLPGHFRRVYEYIIEPACRLAGFKAKRADDVKSANIIMIDILESILHSDMAICDLSASNPNVLYELGIRQSFDMPVTLIKDELTKDIFDIQGIRYLLYNSQLRIDLVGEAIQTLASIITETYENRSKDVSSLVQILGREKATIKSSKLSNDTTILLDAMERMYEKIQLSTSKNSDQQGTAAVLRNGLVVRIGDHVKHPSRGSGVIAGIDNNIVDPRVSIMFPTGIVSILASTANSLTKEVSPSSNMGFDLF